MHEEDLTISSDLTLSFITNREGQT